MALRPALVLSDGVGREREVVGVPDVENVPETLTETEVADTERLDVWEAVVDLLHVRLGATLSVGVPVRDGDAVAVQEGLCESPVALCDPLGLELQLLLEDRLTVVVGTYVWLRVGVRLQGRELGDADGEWDWLADRVRVGDQRTDRECEDVACEGVGVAVRVADQPMELVGLRVEVKVPLPEQVTL